MNMKKIFGVSLLLSVIVNIALLYRLLDTGISVSYQADELGYKSKQLTDVQKMFPVLVPKMSRADLLEKARKTGLEIIEKKDDNTVYVGGIQFVLSNDQVTAIKFE